MWPLHLALRHCLDHGPNEGRRHPLYANLARQFADYLEMQLRAWRAAARGGTPFSHIVQTIAGRLDEKQIRAVALYYQSLAPDAAPLIADPPANEPGHFGPRP